MTDSAFYYLQLAKMRGDSFYGEEKAKMNQFQNLVLEDQFKSQEEENKRIQYVQKLKTNAFMAGGLVLIIFSLFLFRTNLNRKKTNKLLNFQKEKVENTLQELKSTQAQLIQSEKMASLGELTAGIAHEIQNPLNFVNNFSEINTELIQELKGQRLKVKGEKDARIETGILNDIEENEKKIVHHGKRADAIVKGMLQHSQKSSGIKEPTNINVLVEEYYRLAYQSYISMEKLSTEIKLITDLDANLPLVNVILQDIGRVLLNLYNNAFWFLSEALAKDRARAEKSKGDSKSPLVENYIPTIKLSTKKIGDKIEIRIRDNGPGIPQNIISKIFQPFFTTKPAGKGTGLGLSLAYDIIKAHGGSISCFSDYSEPGTKVVNTFNSPEGGPPGGLPGGVPKTFGIKVDTPVGEGPIGLPGGVSASNEMMAGAIAPTSRSLTAGRETGSEFIIQLPLKQNN